jgi:TRAP-type C4-dicarboxylate transport system permease large subunit
MNEVMIGALPFVVMMIGMIVILAMFPALALWLPQAFG